MRTSNPNVYAVGDVTGEYMLVHVAIYQGEVAARNACLGTNERVDYRLTAAHTVFTDPQFAAVGASEKELERNGTPYVRGRYDFAEHGKAQCLGKTKGFVKMMADRERGRILGAAVLGPQASELIHEIIVAMRYDATVDDFMRIPICIRRLRRSGRIRRRSARRAGRRIARRRAGGNGDERQR